MNQKLTYSLTETAQVLGISKPTLYRLLHKEGFPVFCVGSRRLVSVDGLRKWVLQQSEVEI